MVGDRIRVLVQKNGLNVDIAGIDIEKQTRPVTGIYRGKIEFLTVLIRQLLCLGSRNLLTEDGNIHPVSGYRASGTAAIIKNGLPKD